MTRQLIGSTDNDATSRVLYNSTILKTPIWVCSFANDNGSVVGAFHCCIVMVLPRMSASRCYVVWWIVYCSGYDGRKLKENIECEIFQTILDEARDSYSAEIVHELPSNTPDDMESNVNRILDWLKVNGALQNGTSHWNCLCIISLTRVLSFHFMAIKSKQTHSCCTNCNVVWNCDNLPSLTALCHAYEHSVELAI